MSRFIRELDKKHKQENLGLRFTKGAVQVWRELRKHGVTELQKENINKAFSHIESFAKKEWGEGTTVDDFSIEGKVVIRNGNKEEII